MRDRADAGPAFMRMCSVAFSLAALMFHGCSGSKDKPATSASRERSEGQTADTSLQSRDMPLPLEIASRSERVFRRALSPDKRWVAEDVQIASGYFRARLIDSRTQDTVPLGDSRQSSWGPAWSPDGKRLALFVNDHGNATLWTREISGDSQRVGSFFGVPVGPYSSGEAVQWLTNQHLVSMLSPEGQVTPADGFALGQIAFVDNGPDQPVVVVFGGDSNRKVSAARKPCGLTRGLCDLGVIDVRNGTVTRLAHNIEVTATGVPTFQVSRDANLIAYFSRVTGDTGAARGYMEALYEFGVCDVSTGACRKADKQVALDDFSTWRSRLAEIFPDTKWPEPDSVVDEKNTPDPRSRYTLGTSRMLRWKSPDGAPGAASLLLPPDYREGTRLPLIVWVYGNDKGSVKGFNWGRGVFDFQVLATRGYAVLYPDTPVGVGSVRRDIFRGVMHAVDAAIAQGFADQNRLAIMGQSGGSQSVLSVIGLTQRFKAAVVTGSVNHPDLVAAYLQGGPEAPPDQIGRYYERSDPRMAGTPWEYRERYIVNSPIYDFDKIQTPVLMGKGDNDSDDRFASDAIFLALRRLGKTVEYRVYRGETHVISRPANVVDFWKRRLEFLAKYLDLQVDEHGAVSSRRNK
jgi:hypothetical protein